MKPSRRTASVHDKAMRLRAKANDTAALLEETDSQTDPGRFEQLCWLVKHTEGAAKRAEKRAAEQPVEKQRAQRIKKAARTNDQNNGSRVAQDDDGVTVQRVTSCVGCFRAVAIVDPTSLRQRGWGARWDTASVPPMRLWLCDECWIPPRIQPSDAEPRMPESWRSDAKIAEEVGAIMARLAEVAPNMHASFLKQLGVK